MLHIHYFALFGKVVEVLDVKDLSAAVNYFSSIELSELCDSSS